MAEGTGAEHGLGAGIVRRTGERRYAVRAGDAAMPRPVDAGQPVVMTDDALRLAAGGDDVDGELVVTEGA